MSCLKRAFFDRVRAFASDGAGNIAIIFAFSLLPIILAVGSAIDYGHYNSVRVRLQAALDNTGLALAHDMDGLDDDELEALAKTYFSENFPEQAGVVVTSLQAVADDDDLYLEVHANVEMYIMHLAGVQYLPANVDAEIVRSEDSYEVVLVLDNTGSMRGSKINALEDAAKLLTNNLFGETSTHPLLDMALVPFSHAVNVGTGNKNASWMDTNGKNPLHYDNFDEEEMKRQNLTRFDLFDRIRNVSWSGCVDARAHPLDVQDTAASSSDPDTLFVPYFAPDEPDESFVCEKYRHNGTCRRGEIVEDTYNNSYLDDGVDEEDSDEEKQQNVDKYSDRVRARNGSPNEGCTANPIVPLTNKKSTILSGLGDMKANGYTNIPEGLMWGMRVISPGAPFTEGKPYTEKNHHKIIILLTDGNNDVPSFLESPNINHSEYGPWGYAASDRLIETTSRNSYRDAMDDRTEEACNAVKSENIDLFTITFQVSDDDTITLMQNCATQPDMYYNSPSTSTLDDVFQEIADRISELRLAS